MKYTVQIDEEDVDKIVVSYLKDFVRLCEEAWRTAYKKEDKEVWAKDFHAANQILNSLDTKYKPPLLEA